MRRSALKSCCRGTVRGVGRGCQLLARESCKLRAKTRRTLKKRSTASHPLATISLGGTGSPSLVRESWPTQVEGEWPKSTVVSSMLCRMRAMKRHTAATPTWLPPCKTHVGHHARRRKSKREFSTKQTSAKFILQATAPAHCCCDAERQQSPSLPRRRLG